MTSINQPRSFGLISFSGFGLKHWSFVLHFLQVREIELEAQYETEVVQEKDSKQNAAIDLSKRLKDFRSLNDASSLKGTIFSGLN